MSTTKKNTPKGQHTQGVWRLYLNPVSKITEYIIENPESRTIARVKSEEVTEDEVNANAKLIASAPELLKALIALKKEYQDYQAKTGNQIGLGNAPAEELAIIAIKKATE